ncbi:endonuclease/exonuclease/phosphatase family protein [Brucella pseudogrignonensis]|uniref:Endonuclease/exonuclease/phosphatase family metal-dependent hydrolase n=1 Tax=Brucella pseudogrignonensis TaxID=419475 RepID=A0ABU1M6Z0_9HYPH|nr:endonuclease/exonuclease/phosphatase family protein [Brucella pseudogrignonensis]MDR6431813.1 endonuclease/exonuclease/phosphatase family metal-dependent hydrolase [Brucella pseudogrignonensis]
MQKKKTPGRISTKILTAIRNRPGFRPHHPDTPEGDITIASYNVHKCIGVDKVFDPQRTADVISEIDADVIALQEADKRFGERSGLLDLGLLEKRHGLVPVPITSTMPKGHGWHGNILLFREGVVRNVRQLALPGVEPRGALVADLQFSSGPLRVIAAHLGLLKRSRQQQAESILSALEEADTLPTLLIGDLNEWRIGKRSSLASLMPTFDHVATAVPSFPSRFPIFALDRVLGTPHNLVTAVEVHNTPLARMASDHLPIKAHLDLRTASQLLEEFNPSLLTSNSSIEN